MEIVTELSKKIWNAMQTEDVALLTETVHPEAVFVHMGATMSRDVEMNVIKGRGIVYKTVVFEETTVKTFGDTVVLLNKLKLTALVGSNEVTNPFVVTEVYTKDGETYKLGIMSYTRIVY